MTTFAQAVDEVKQYIADRVREDLDTDAIGALAEEYVWHGIEKGPDPDGYMHAEIRGRHSRSGNPVPFSFDAVDE